MHQEHHSKADPLSIPMANRPKLSATSAHQIGAKVQDQATSSPLLAGTKAELLTRNKLSSTGGDQHDSCLPSEGVTSVVVKPYQRKRTWDVDSQIYVIKSEGMYIF